MIKSYKDILFILLYLANVAGFSWLFSGSTWRVSAWAVVVSMIIGAFSTSAEYCLVDFIVRKAKGDDTRKIDWLPERPYRDPLWWRIISRIF